MRITSIRLRNFKRFTDLFIHSVPRTAKLVVVVGPNGCGKSSLFDALIEWHRLRAGIGFPTDETYYRKSAADAFNWHQQVEVSLDDGAAPRAESLYVRTAYRNEPDFMLGGVNRLNSPASSPRFNRLIENDATVSENYQRLVYQTVSNVWDKSYDAKTVLELREELVGQVRETMKRVFDDLELLNISDPLGSGTFYFAKGEAKRYHYKNLSGGEKAAFDLLLDIHIKKQVFQDAIYCVDELETHLHTRVQGVLLREILRVLPEPCQLWVTTHSLGVLRAAQELAAQAPGTVALIDFEGVDPDVPQELAPSNLGRVAWEKMLSVALDDLSSRIAPTRVVVCEGSSVGKRRKDFDAEVYNRVLGAYEPEVLFVSGGNSQQVQDSGVSVRDLLTKFAPTAKVVALADRDDKSPAEVEDFERRGGIVLRERNLESYLFADDVLEALLAREGKPQVKEEVRRLKTGAIAASVARGNAPDDIKSAAGELYVGLKKLLGLKSCGNSTDAFMRDTLAPLIRPPMATYTQLHAGIVARLK
jgi:predicted ATPase